MCFDDWKIALSLKTDRYKISSGETLNFDGDLTIYSVVIGAPISGQLELQVTVNGALEQLAQRSSEAPSMFFHTKEDGLIFEKPWAVVSRNAAEGTVLVSRLPVLNHKLNACDEFGKK